MKKCSFVIVLLLALSAFSNAFAISAPTVYGSINKELRYVDQDTQADRRELGVASDVINSPSRFGFKGEETVREDLKASYLFEVGIFSLGSSRANVEMLQVRRVFGKLSSHYGDILIGDDFLPEATRMLALDPLGDTSVGMYGLDLALDAAGFETTGNGFYSSRVFRDQLTYNTPDFHGLRYTVTLDTNNVGVFKRITDQDRWISHLLTYDKDLGGIGVNATFAYNTQIKYEGANREEYYWNLGLKIILGDLSIGALYGMRDYTVDATRQSYDEKRMMFALGYDWEDFTFGLTYGSTTFDDNAAAPVSGDQYQLATGVIYKLSKNVQTHFVLATAERNSKAALGAVKLPLDTNVTKKTTVLLQLR